MKSKPFSLRWIFLLTVLLAGCRGEISPAPTIAEPPAPTDTAVPASLPSATPTEEAALPPGNSKRALTVGGIERKYYVHVFPGFDPAQPVPLVLAFHGYSHDGEIMISYSGLGKVADSAGFLAVFPDGYDPGGQLSWNVGNDCCSETAALGTDEAAFVREILADLQTLATIDPKRIYATGYDIGALLTYRLGCEMPDTFAAIAPVAGLLVFDPCRPSEPVSLLHVHGAEDQFFPLEGPVSNPFDDKPFPAVLSGVETWVAADGCPIPPQVEGDGATTHTVYAPCQRGTAVEVVVVNDNGHRWPADFLWPAAQRIWEFFADHPKT